MSAHRLQASSLGALAYYGGLRMLGLTSLRRLHQDGGLILCYHNVVAGAGREMGDPSLHMSRDRFERQMWWLARHYNVVSLREFVRRLETGASLRSVAAITFDDAYLGVFEHADPVLEALELPATVFVVADAPGRSHLFWWDRPEVVRSPGGRDRWVIQLRGDETAIVPSLGASTLVSLPATHYAADWRTIRARTGGRLDIGVHSATHRSLTLLSDADLEREIVTSRAMLYEATGVWPQCFAYPYGLWDRRVRGAVQAAGYDAACTTSPSFGTRPADVWALPRLNIPAGISNGAFVAWTAGFRGSGQ
jgi:peptidoglycan/xylan/chitin deacetylase (PgdA/CDA1 family)